jgi:chaperonin GroES
MNKNAKTKSVSKAKSLGVRPLGDRVLIRPTKEEERRVGALILPATGEREKPDTGIVVAAGEGKLVDGKLVPLSVKVGDKVMFSKYSYDELKLDNEEYYIIKEDNIFAVIS